jgi:peroxiredoxin
MCCHMFREKYKFGTSIFRNMRIIYLFAGFLLFIHACSSDRTNFTVEVDVSNADNGLLYLAQRKLTGTITVDSALPDKSGRYELEGYVTQPDFFIVYRQPQRYINLVIHPGDHFRVITDATTFDYNYLVEGSKDSRLIQKMVNMQTRTLEKITEISTEYENSRGSKDFDKIKARIDHTYDQIVAEHKLFSIGLIEENPESLVGLMALYQHLGRNAPVFDYKKDFKYYELVDSSLSRLFPRSEAVIDLNRKVTELRELLRLEAGSPAPEISLPDRQGNIVPLSSLKGKNVLLIFWASWSSQSLAEMNKLTALYPKLAGSDLEYYQVSLDRTRESWLNMTEQRKIQGVHVSDLKYWDSPVVSLYHIEQLPVLYLLDKQGVIVRKDLKTEEIQEILAGIRNEK